MLKLAIAISTLMQRVRRTFFWIPLIRCVSPMSPISQLSHPFHLLSCFCLNCGESECLAFPISVSCAHGYIPNSHGPDHDKSPHAVNKDVLYEPLFKGLAVLAATTDPRDGQLSPTKEQLLALRMVAFGLSTDHLEILTSLLLSRRMTYNFPHDHWTANVQDCLDGKPLMEVHTAQFFVDMVDLLPSGRQSIVLINKQGQQLTARAVTSL